jgi:hypothetical protein
MSMKQQTKSKHPADKWRLQQIPNVKRQQDGPQWKGSAAPVGSTHRPAKGLDVAVADVRDHHVHQHLHERRADAQALNRTNREKTVIISKKNAIGD